MTVGVGRISFVEVVVAVPVLMGHISLVEVVVAVPVLMGHISLVDISFRGPESVASLDARINTINSPPADDLYPSPSVASLDARINTFKSPPADDLYPSPSAHAINCAATSSPTAGAGAVSGSPNNTNSCIVRLRSLELTTLRLLSNLSPCFWIIVCVITN